MAYDGDGRLPIIYVRGFAGGGSAINRWQAVGACAEQIHNFVSR